MKSLHAMTIGDPAVKSMGTAGLLDVPVPEVGKEQLRIKVAYASICGSDGHTLTGNLGPFRESVMARLPVPMGHEVSGVVESVSPEAAAAGWKVGDRVACNYSHFCGSCYWCRTGRENFCTHPTNYTNGMSEYYVCHMSQAYKVADDVDLKYACLAEPLSIAYGAVEMAKVHMGSRVAIFGGGGIGLMAVQLAKLAGAAYVVLMEPVEAKRELGKSLGADEAWDPIHDDIWEKTMAYTGGLGFDSVIEASGASSAAMTALKILSRDGNVVYFAMYRTDFDMPVNLFNELYFQQKHIHGMFTTADQFERVIPMLRRVNLEPIVQKVYPLEEYEQAFADQLSGKYAKIVFKCNDD